jgi:hypothetical protein
MKYKYYDQRGRLLCESDSPITFNLELYPIWKYLKLKVDDSEPEVLVAKAIPKKEEVEEAEDNYEVHKDTFNKKRKKENK